MSELILLRNKIKTIQTIQKITHTMRLIAMSGHTALKKREAQTNYYIKAIYQALKTIYPLILSQEKEQVTILQHPKTLCIVIGSQKGLCGSFNTQIEPLFITYQEKLRDTPFDVALIGAQIIKNTMFTKNQNVVYKEPQLSQKNSSSILEYLKNLLSHYDQVSIISNHFQSFFVQEARTTTLLPIDHDTENTESDTIPYLCDEPIELIYTLLWQKYIHAQISFLLYQSLLSEHAARFTSMDAANRNAKTMLGETKIKYNKLRQTKITTEINELSANFAQN